jgi:hypothetical protein
MYVDGGICAALQNSVAALEMVARETLMDAATSDMLLPRQYGWPIANMTPQALI